MLLSQIGLDLHIRVSTMSHWVKTYMHARLDNISLSCTAVATLRRYRSSASDLIFDINTVDTILADNSFYIERRAK